MSDIEVFEHADIRNETDVPTESVIDALRDDRGLMASFEQWVNKTKGGQFTGYRAGGLFERDRYATPFSLYEQMRVATDAVESDDVVSGVADTTEALAFSKVSFYAEDNEEEDIYNQIAADLDLDSRLREIWRELFTCSQCYVAVWWTKKKYSVRGKTEKGNQRRKSYDIRVPEAISLLDPLRIVPVGSMLFNRESLAYMATRDEAEIFDDESARLADPIINRLILTKHIPTQEDKAFLAANDLQSDNLYILNPQVVFRHTLTRPQFRRLSPVRMKSVFELLDLKNQLRSMDRAHLIGGTNFIVLIKKGSDAMPGKPQEIANLQQNVKTLARLPVIVGDHRLEVEIITPKLDATLNGDRYGTLDSRITARLYGMFVMGGNRAGGTNADDSSGLVKVISRGIESRRHMIQRSLERNIFGPLFDRNDVLTTAPKMKFHPKSIDLGFDSALASFMMELRQSRELSRETLLSQWDFDQDDEARMLDREAEKFDDIFQTQIPYSAPAPQNQDPAPPITPSEKRRAGRQGGGNKNGGGSAPGTGQGKPAIRPRQTSDSLEDE